MGLTLEIVGAREVEEIVGGRDRWWKARWWKARWLRAYCRDFARLVSLPRLGSFGLAAPYAAACAAKSVAQAVSTIGLLTFDWSTRYFTFNDGLFVDVIYIRRSFTKV